MYSRYAELSSSVGERGHSSSKSSINDAIIVTSLEAIVTSMIFRPENLF